MVNTFYSNFQKIFFCFFVALCVSQCMTSLLKLEITVFFWLSLPGHSGSLKRIDYPKQICLAHPHSFECFHCS